MQAALTVLYERNLFYQQLDYKWKSYLHLRRLLSYLHARPNLGFCRTTLLTFLFHLTFLLDFTLGACLLLALQRYVHIRPLFTNWISVYTWTMLRWVKELIVWLMGVPGGLKLNTPLANFLGTRMLSIVNLWGYFYSDFISTYLDTILSLIFLLSPFGVTLSITALHDFLKFLNLCSICFFIITGRVLSLQISALKSLARLFMGKKWNILRERIDSCDYDNSQLLVGTILFTILLFLLPTTSVYFLIFLLLRVLQFSVQLALRIVTVFVNHMTLLAWKQVTYFIDDHPLTSLKMSVDFIDTGEKKESAENLIGECECTRHGRHANLRLNWNGREYSVEEVKALIAATPEKEILNQVRKCQGLTSADQIESESGINLEHPMLNLSGSVKLWPR